MKVNAFRSAATVAFSVAFAGVMFAQSSPQSSPPQSTPPPTTRPQTDSQQDRQSGTRGMDGQTVTVTGCLAQEKSVAGQTPNVAERAGVTPDYILTNVQMRSAAPSASGATGAPGAPGSRPTTGAPGSTGTPPSATGAPGAAAAGAAGAAGATNVRLKEVDNDQMRANLNKRVEVTGRFEAAPEATAGAAVTPGPNKPIPEVHVTNVRALNEPCTPQQ